MSTNASTVPDRISRQMRFLIELDKLKTVLRQTLIADGSRQENTAEHSWHLATMALVLAEYAPQPLDLQRALAIALVHDLVEIHAGDSFCYDPNAMRTKEAREALAAARLFTLLPPEQASYLHQLWQEFEACNTNEARYITALDRLQPLLQNYASRGGSWKRHGITLARVIERSAPIADTCPLLWDFARKLIEDAAYQGLFPTSSGSA